MYVHNWVVYIKVARIQERWTVNQKLKNESNPEGKGIPDSYDTCSAEFQFLV